MKDKKERKSKYAVPHYDRVSPRIRYGVRAGLSILSSQEGSTAVLLALKDRRLKGKLQSLLQVPVDGFGVGVEKRDKRSDPAWVDIEEMTSKDTAYAGDFESALAPLKEKYGAAAVEQQIRGVQFSAGDRRKFFEEMQAQRRYPLELRTQLLPSDTSDMFLGHNPYTGEVEPHDFEGDPKESPMAAATFWHWNPATDECLLTESVCCHEFARYGQQVFSLSPLIGEMLENTDLGAITFDDLQLPFNCFYVQLEGNQKYSGFYVHKLEDTLTFLVTKWHEEMPEDRYPDTLHYWENTEEVLNRGDYWRFFFQFELSKYEKGCSVAEATSLLLTGTPTNASWTEEQKQAHRYENEDPDEVMRDILRLTFSLLFYLNSERKSVEVSSGKDEREKEEAALAGSGKTPSSRSSKKNKRRKEKLRYLSKAKFHQVGVQEEKDLVSTPGFDIDQPRHWRRGHLHRYWVGSRKDADGNPRKGEKLIRLWIIPTLINPEGEIEQDCIHRLVVKREQETLVAKIHREGGEIAIPEQTKRERDPSLRNPCIAHHGAFCNLYPYCSEDGSRFGPNRFNKSGSVGGWLHVHHLDPLGDAVEERNVDPLTDLVPVCGTCHGFIHSRRPAYSVEEAREIMQRWQEEEEEEAAK